MSHSGVLQPVALGFYLLWSEARFCFKLKLSCQGHLCKSSMQVFLPKTIFLSDVMLRFGDLKCRAAVIVAPVRGPGQKNSQGAFLDVNEKIMKPVHVCTTSDTQQLDIYI